MTLNNILHVYIVVAQLITAEMSSCSPVYAKKVNSVYWFNWSCTIFNCKKQKMIADNSSVATTIIHYSWKGSRTHCLFLRESNENFHKNWYIYNIQKFFSTKNQPLHAFKMPTRGIFCGWMLLPSPLSHFLQTIPLYFLEKDQFCITCSNCDALSRQSPTFKWFLTT